MTRGRKGPAARWVTEGARVGADAGPGNHSTTPTDHRQINRMPGCTWLPCSCCMWAAASSGTRLQATEAGKGGRD